MNRWCRIALVLVAVAAWSSTECWARGGRGGGGGGGRVGGGGAGIAAGGGSRGYVGGAGARGGGGGYGGGYSGGAAARTPSMSRSSLPASLTVPSNRSAPGSG